MNRSQIRLLTRNSISQPTEATSDFLDTEINGFIDEGIQYFAPLVKWPRDKVSWQTEVGKPGYTLPSDFILLITADYGDPSVDGGVYPLQVMTEFDVRTVRPGWMSQASTAWGKPRRAFILDRQTIAIDPPPDSASSVGGQKLIMGYVYMPQALSDDGSEPVLPAAYHPLLAEYAQSKCYLGKLNKPDLGASLFDLVTKKAKTLEGIVTRETDQQAMGWGNADSPDDDDDFRIMFG